MRTRAIIYYDWQRHWYHLLDVVQPTWLRFRDSAAGRVTIWLALALVWLVVKVMWKALVWTLIIGVGLSFYVLSWCLGTNKLLKKLS